MDFKIKTIRLKRFKSNCNFEHCLTDKIYVHLCIKIMVTLFINHEFTGCYRNSMKQAPVEKPARTRLTITI